MKEYVLLFRMDILTESAQPTEEQMKGYLQQWNAWLNEMIDQGQLAEGGNHLSRKGKLIRSNGEVMDKPYAINNESVAGYIIILAKNMNEAVAFAKKCPILHGEGTSVEIRETEN